MTAARDGKTGSIQIGDAWWAALAAELLHPVQVQVIEVLSWIEEPLSASDLAEIIDVKLPRSQLVHHLRRLDRIGAVEAAEHPTLRNATSIRFRLCTG